MYNFTPIDFPDGVNLPVIKDAASGGFDLVATRTIIGDVEHITRTNGQIEHLHQLMNVGGSRDDLLVDAVIGRDGRIGYLNRPFGPETPARASWINLGLDAELSAAGAAFVSRFGTEGLGRYLLSKAHICRTDQGLTDAQFEASAQLSAAIHQQACCPWDQYPFNPLYGSILSFWHCDFGFATCPSDAFRRRWVRPLRERVRALLRAAQIGVVEDRTPYPWKNEPPVGPRYPDGWTESIARQRFGELRCSCADEASGVLTFDPQHIICCEWLRRGWLTAGWPEAVTWTATRTVDGQREDVVVFADGQRLVRQSQAAPWHWELAAQHIATWQDGEATHAVGT